jgi:TatD DNase family protein
MFTDSHCHLASHKFPPEEIPELIARAKEAGIHRLITLATSTEDIPLNLALAEGHPEVYACLGIHPCDVHETPDHFEDQLRPLLSHPKVAAIGETGLDYFHPAPEGWTEEHYHARQRDFLRRHFALAAEFGLNIVIHIRDRSGQASLDDALTIYREFHEEVTAVFHCFPGPFELAEPILALGGLLSFTGIATFKNAAACLDAATQVPADRLMVETDAPYLAPAPHRGQRNEPAFTLHTAAAIAQARNIALSTLSEETEATVNRFFRLGT